MLRKKLNTKLRQQLARRDVTEENWMIVKDRYLQILTLINWIRILDLCCDKLGSNCLGLAYYDSWLDSLKQKDYIAGKEVICNPLTQTSTNFWKSALTLGKLKTQLECFWSCQSGKNRIDSVNCLTVSNLNSYSALQPRPRYSVRLNQTTHSPSASVRLHTRAKSQSWCLSLTLLTLRRA